MPSSTPRYDEQKADDADTSYFWVKDCPSGIGELVSPKEAGSYDVRYWSDDPGGNELAVASFTVGQGTPSPSSGASASADSGTGNPGVIKVLLNNQPLKLEVPPQVENGRTMIPLRAIFEALGASVQWNPADQSITATKGSQVLTLTVGSDTALNNGSKVNLDVPPMIVGGRTLVPLRFVSENLGAQVGWDGNTRQVSITSSGQTNLPAAAEMKLTPARIHEVIGSTRTQFQQLTKVNKLSQADALAQQIASLKQQPDVDLVEQLENTTDLKVRFKDGYEVVMVQGGEGTRGGPALPGGFSPQQSLVTGGLAVDSSVKQHGALLPDLDLKLNPEQISPVNRPANPNELVDSGAGVINRLDLTQIYQTRSPTSHTALIFDTTADNPNQMATLDSQINYELFNMGYYTYQSINDAADLKAASEIDDKNLGIAYISSHGTVVNGEFYFTVRPYYDSPPPADSGYVGTKVFNVYTGDGYKTAYVYGVGKEFAQTYWTKRFPGSIFLMSTCHSANSSGIYSLPNWTVNNGANSWLGWTDSVKFSNSDKGTLTFFNYMTNWKNVEEARAAVNGVINPKNPEMWRMYMAGENSPPTLPHYTWETFKETYPAGQDFFMFRGERFDDSMYVWVNNVTNSQQFNLELDNNGDGKTEVRVKFTPAEYQVYSVAGDGQETFKELGKSIMKGNNYITAIPWSTLFGSGTIKRYRLTEGADSSGDAMPNGLWREEPSGLWVPVS